MPVPGVLSGTRPRWLQGWDRGAWDVAASLGYVAVTSPGWRGWPSSAAVWIAAGWAVASTFRKKERGERLRLSCPKAVPPACLGAARASSAPARGRALHPWSS